MSGFAGNSVRAEQTTASCGGHRVPKLTHRSMKTVLMFPYANHLGGTQPLVAIGSALRDAGHNVVFAARGKCRGYVEECGFEVEDVAELDPERAVAYINKSSLDYHTRESIAEFVDAEMALIAKHNADAVVDLHRPTLKLSAMLSQTPRAVLS